MGNLTDYIAHFDGGTKKIPLYSAYASVPDSSRDCIYWGFQIWEQATKTPPTISSQWNIEEVDDDDANVIKEVNGFTSDYTTNNEAEYTALIKLLEELRNDSTLERLWIPNIIKIKGDSKLVIQQVFGNWKVKADNLKPFNEKAKMLVTELFYQHEIEIIASHSPREESKQSMVDKWARQALINGKKVEHTNLQHQGGETI